MGISNCKNIVTDTSRPGALSNDQSTNENGISKYIQYIVVVFRLGLVYVYPTLIVIVTCTFMRAVFKTLCRPFTLAGS